MLIGHLCTLIVKFTFSCRPNMNNEITGSLIHWEEKIHYSKKFTNHAHLHYSPWSHKPNRNKLLITSQNVPFSIKHLLKSVLGQYVGYSCTYAILLGSNLKVPDTVCGIVANIWLLPWEMDRTGFKQCQGLQGITG